MSKHGGFGYEWDCDETNCTESGHPEYRHRLRHIRRGIAYFTGGFECPVAAFGKGQVPKALTVVDVEAYNKKRERNRRRATIIGGRIARRLTREERARRKRGTR